MAHTAARVLFVEHFEPNVLGWDATNPYEDSMLSSFSLHIPDTSTDTADGMNASRQLINDSLEPFALPEPLLPTRQPISPIHEMAPHGFPGDAAPLDVTMRDNVAFAPPTMSLRQQQSGKPQLPFILPATSAAWNQVVMSSDPYEAFGYDGHRASVEEGRSVHEAPEAS